MLVSDVDDVHDGDLWNSLSCRCCLWIVFRPSSDCLGCHNRSHVYDRCCRLGRHSGSCTAAAAAAACCCTDQAWQLYCSGRRLALVFEQVEGRSQSGLEPVVVAARNH